MNTVSSSLQVKRNIADSLLFLPFQAFLWNSAALDSSNDYWTGSPSAPWGLASAGTNSIVGRSKKQMAQIVTQTSVSCRLAMTLQMCFQMNVALHKETVWLRINLGTLYERKTLHLYCCIFAFNSLNLTAQKQVLAACRLFRCSMETGFLSL